jgi:hypothetical protein
MVPVEVAVCERRASYTRAQARRPGITPGFCAEINISMLLKKSHCVR